MNGFLLAVTQFSHMLDEYDKHPKEMREYLKSLQEKNSDILLHSIFEDFFISDKQEHLKSSLVVPE